MSKSEFESMFEFRCKFAGHFLLRPGASFLSEPVYGLVLACPFALHPMSFPVTASSLSELWNAQGDGCCQLEQLYPSVKCLESEVRVWYDGERRSGERSRQGEVHDEGQGSEERVTQDPERVIPLQIVTR